MELYQTVGQIGPAYALVILRACMICGALVPETTKAGYGGRGHIERHNQWHAELEQEREDAGGRSQASSLLTRPV